MCQHQSKFHFKRQTNQNRSMIENQLKKNVELSRGIFGFKLFIVEILSRLMRQMNLNTNNVTTNGVVDALLVATSTASVLSTNPARRHQT